MKKVLILFVFAFVFAYNFAQNPVKAKVKTPAIYFEETARDFGTVTEGTSSEMVFTFFNSGTAPLLLKNVKPACGCTTPKWPKHPIMPGQNGEIKAIFNSANLGGQSIHKSITVTTNVPENGNDKVIILYIKGFVKK